MKKNNIVKNSLYNIIKTCSTIVFPLITFPYISRVLGAENVGKLNFSSSVISYISLIASLGISTYAIRECSKDKNNKELLSHTASEIFTINIFSTLISYAILFLLLIFWPSLKSYRIIILVQGINVIFTTLGADWLNSAMEDFKYIAIRTFSFQLISLLCMFIFVRKTSDYLQYAIITVISASGGNVLNVFYRRKYCRVTITRQISWKKKFPPIMLLFAMLLSQTIFVNVDTTMLGVMRSDLEVGLYSTTTKIYNMINQVIASICWVVMPQLSESYRDKNYDSINSLLKYSLNFIVVLGLPAVTGLFIMAPDIIMAVGGTSYLPATTSLRILSLALLFSLFGGFVGNVIFLPSGREKIFLFTCIISAVINFGLNIILIPQYGIEAAAATTALAQFIGFIMNRFFVEKEVNVGKLSEIFRGPIIGCVCISIICFLVKVFVNNWLIRLMLAFVFSIIVYFAILLLTNNKFARDLFIRLKNKRR